MSNTNHASEETRSENLRAVRQRAAWRDRYAILSNSIRVAKRRLSNGHRYTCYEPRLAIELHALQELASLMMTQRDVIKTRLKTTAYPYLREEIAA